MAQCQSERDGKTRRQYSSIWAKQLKELRERNNLSQADVAKVLHCSQVAYGMYELGKRKLPIERLIMLAEFLPCIAGFADRAFTGMKQAKKSR